MEKFKKLGVFVATALAAAMVAVPAARGAEYEIGTLEELREFMEAVHVEDFAGDTITLTADIDCEGGRFNTGDPEYPSTFRGTFDGGGHVISNFVHSPTNGTAEGYGIAMFDFTETGAVIQNLTLEGTLPDTHTGAYSAPFVLAVEDPLGLYMDNCHFRGCVTNYRQAAGLVGFASPGSGAAEGTPSVILTNCSVRGDIVSTWVYTAGGLVAKGTGILAFDCSVEGEIRGARTGGLVGEAYGGSFEGCSFEGTMRPDRETVGNCIQGGLAAEASNAVFLACTSAVGFDSRAAAAGGAAGVTHGSAAFHDCSATVEAAVPTGRIGGFVGWTAGAETFSNCTATMTVDAIPVIDPETHQTNIYSLATGGFAGSVASDGALFVDCTASARGNDLKGGFYYNQQPYSTNSPVGSNTFLRCHVVDSTAKAGGFCMNAWNCAFEGCTVRGGTGGAGFVQSAGGQPDKQYNSEYSYEQTSTFTDCSVHGTRASYGFVMSANSSDKNGHTNIFRRCRAGCIYGNSNNSGAQTAGFGTLHKGTIAEDCAAYGIADMGDLEAGFADTIGVGATVRRCVGAVYPRGTDVQGGGFAELISYTATVEDCYAVYAPYANAVEPYSDQAYKYGVQGGFVRRTSIGYNADDLPIVRCFALWPLSEPVSGQWISGSFCGVTPNSTSTNYFEDCYRPAEAAIGSCHNEDAAGVEALTKAEFAGATAATMPNYDFADTWHAPGGVASSPYLDASVDENGDFWFLAGVIGAEGRILVNGEAPREAYPAGSVLTVQAVPDNPDIPFAGWVGDGFADPTAQTTTYTVKNVSAIAAEFCTPIYTVDDWTNRAYATYISSDTTAYALMNDLDFTDYIASNGWNYVDGYYAFAGKLFGQGHTIRGLVTTKGSFNTTQALFSSLANGAEIRDLTIEFSNVPGDQNTLSLAGLAASIGSGCLISNCHVKADWQGVYPEVYVSPAYKSCQYYGLAQTVSGTGIRIVDCTVEGKLAGGTAACGFVGSATLNGGEIARCAVFADVSTITNRTDGDACGFAGSLDLTNAVVRECFAAGTVDAARSANGFAGSILFRDSASSIRDCYSTMEVASRGSRHNYCYANGIADTISGAWDNPGAKVENVWFGGTVRGGYQQYAFVRGVDYATVENGRWLAVDGGAAQGTEGATEIAVADRLKAASWEGYDLGGVWAMEEGKTTPYFAWSLAEGTDFRLFAVQEEGKTVTIGESAAPGAEAAVSAVAEDDSFFCGWTGGATYTNAAVTPSALLADNHRTARCVWGIAVTNRAGLAAITNDLTGIYGLGADIDLSGENWTPIGNSDYTAFSGTIYGQGHVISSLTVDTEGAACAGLFGYLSGATIMDLTLENPVVRGANCVGALAGFVDGATISGCTVSGADVTATSERAGCFVGQLEGGATVTRCSATGRIAGSGRYVGGFVGSVAGTTALEKCFALAEVSGAGEGVGGFAGYAEDTPTFSECFACGGVDSTGNGAGGFAGYLYESPAVSDCYALADVKGGNYVGGFAGHLYYCNGAFERCYAASTETSPGETGGFAGRQYRGSPSFADCFRTDGGRGDVGAEDVAGIDALDAAGMRSTDNFEAFLETDKWTQADGLTQPYFAWSLADGKMTLGGKIAGTGAGTIGGTGAYTPGASAPIEAVPEGSVFLGWSGNAAYADAASAETTVLVDNFRTVTAEFGALVTTREELEAIADGLGGSYALGADIDLGDAPWTPIGTSSAPFTGSLYGQGHSISGLAFDNTSSGDANGSHAGLFRYAKDATFVGVVLEDADVNGYQYVGALAGEVQGVTTVRDCSAGGTVNSSNGHVGMLVGRVYNANGTVFEGCEAEGAVESAGANAGGLVGDIYNSTVSFTDCAADVAVSGTGGNNKGGFVGYIEYGGSASFTDCRAEGDVTAPNSSYVGGFIGYAARPVRCEGCQTFGDTSGSSYTGGFVGQASGGDSVFADCVAVGAVTTAEKNGSQVGGFVGYATGERSRYENCASSGAVSAGSGGQVGGFVGQSTGAGIAFENCLASGAEVRTTGSAVGGFAGKSSASNDFTRCQADAPAVSGGGSVGGFIGGAEGGGSRFAWCEANGSVKATSYRAGGFAGQSTASGIRYERCTALGGVESTSYDVGGFAGNVSASNDFLRCMAAGSAAATYNAGGFVGNLSGGGTTVAECFALGDATATRSGDAYAGGFAGYAGYAAAFSDSYSLGTAKGQQYVGGFAGRVSNSGITFERCYAAGAADSAGTWTGGFAGQFQSVSNILDCASLLPRHAAGTGTAGTSEAREGVAELDAAGFLDSGNFHAFLDPDPTPWTQVDGVTQPLLAWSAADGLSVFASVGGTAAGRVAGEGVYAPGATVTVRAESDDGFFVAWTGSTPYDNPTNSTTTVALDNHRVAAVLFGKYVRTAADLQAVTNDLAGIYGLGNDIDLAGIDWTPIGFNNAKFSGTFYGFGHSVSNLVCTNNPGSSYHGLFGWTEGATLDGVKVSGVVQSTSAFTGGLVGVANATTIRDCHADVEVTTSGQYAGALVGGIGVGTKISGCSSKGSVNSTYRYVGGLAGGGGSGNFEIRDCVSSAEVSATGQYVGGFIGTVSGGPVLISGCRADGYAGGSGYVGGFVGYIGSAVTNIDCVARGDVRSTAANYGGFVGSLNDSNARLEDCWCSGAVWGTGGTIGSFIGQKRYGTITNCAIYAFGAGPRPFCGSDAAFEGGTLSAARIEELTHDWPEVKQHVDDATPISTAEELLAVTNDLAGIYVLTADIDLEGAAIEPIGNESTAFSGEFYGQNYAIRNFVVDVTNRYVGLFGWIEGGRVSGVVAEGSVRGAYAGSGSSTGTGGFAGKIGSQSLVDGCSFEGGVTNATTYNAGGFVGWTDGSPVILRSSFTGRVVQQANGSSNAGGFVGNHGGGYVMDCYAVADVDAGNNRYAGGFAGSAGGRIATSWCAASVESTGTYRGAFAGYAQTGYITDSYYDSGKTDLQAVGNIASYDAISALATDDMLHEASFAGFDFVATWNIDEGESTPYLRTGSGEQIVEFDAGEGTCDPSSAVYEIGDRYGDLPVPVWAGHAFLGWFDARDGGTEVTAESRVTPRPARMLYARWTDRQTVTFDANGGTCGTNTATYAIGQAYGEFPSATNGELALAGWYTAPEGGEFVPVKTVVEEVAERTLYAHWGRAQTVVFRPNGGTCPIETLVFGQGGVYDGFEPASWGQEHTFQGWYDALEGGTRIKMGMDVTADDVLELFARWAGPRQTITFDSNGGTCSKLVGHCFLDADYSGFKIPVRGDLAFLGWFDSLEGGERVRMGDPVSQEYERTLYAHWGQIVRFEPNGGTCKIRSRTAVVGGTYTALASATREGFDFLGWFDAQEGGDRVRIGNPVPDQAELTLWAHWGPRRQTVTFDANGGTCTKTTAKYYVGELYTGFKIPVRDGFKFLGWYDALEGGQRVRIGMTVTEDSKRTLFAHWQATAGSFSITGFSRSPRSGAAARGARASAVEYTLRVEVAAGVTYEVQWTPVLGGEWTVLRRWTADADGETSVPVAVPATSPTGFFRVVEADAE